MNNQIQEFISNKNLAVIGASRSGNKFGNLAAKELVKRGYSVYLIHPDTEIIDGIKTYSNLSKVKNLVNTLWVNVPPEKGKEILIEAASLGIKKIWLQQGAESQDLLDSGIKLNLDLIYKKCILMYAEPVGSFHKVHQILWKIFGHCHDTKSIFQSFLHFHMIQLIQLSHYYDR